MRIMALSTLRRFWEKEKYAEQSLKAWNEEMEKAVWSNPQELKRHFRTASVIADGRVVFNIAGNHYRLIVDIDYEFKLVFIIWVGTHKDYDKIDAKTIQYVKT